MYGNVFNGLLAIYYIMEKDRLETFVEKATISARDIRKRHIELAAEHTRTTQDLAKDLIFSQVLAYVKDHKNEFEHETADMERLTMPKRGEEINYVKRYLPIRFTITPIRARLYWHDILAKEFFSDEVEQAYTAEYARLELYMEKERSELPF